MPLLSTQNFPDVEILYGQDLIEQIINSYNQYGQEETIILCRSNKRANSFNAGIRTSILAREEELCAGDLLYLPTHT